MSDFTNAVALHAVSFRNEHGLADARKRGDAPFRLSTAQFDELEALGAVRRATKGDKVHPLDHDLDGRPGGAVVATLTAKHKGGGRWVVVNQNFEPVADTLFDDKDAAEAWIDENSRTLSDEEKLIRDEIVTPDPDAAPDQFSG